ncbi:MAG: hypothetical protein MJ016_02460 [Victivallaceae bacterium]|nr:hypothetical protein [Victivallaceae bacterium]
MRSTHKRFLSALTLAAFGICGAGEVVIEAEDFADRGEWQIVDYANATILLGDKKNAVATTKFKAEPGDYYVFIRVMTHGGGFRCANLSVNGLKLGKIGDEKIPEGGKPGWHWVKKPYKIHLSAENNSIKLIADNEFARVDRFIFSTDPAYDTAAAPAPVKSNRQPSGRQLEGIFQRPKPKGDGPDMLLLSGGRPWIGNTHANHFAQAGYRVTLINSVYLDGCGGASIKITPSDPVEPKPLDGITPEFADLGKYKIVVFDTMPLEGQEKLFTPERIEALKKFVSDGGSVVFTVNVPEKLGDLLPVEKQKVMDSMDKVDVEGAYVSRPQNAAFGMLPEKWDVFTEFRFCQAKPGARVLANVCDPQGNAVSPYLVEMDYGKGKVIFWNAQYERLQKTRQLFGWAYTPALSGAIAETVCPDGKVDAGANLKKQMKIAEGEIQPKTLESAQIAISSPEFSLHATDAAATVQGDEIVFGNGAKIKIAEDKKSVDLYFAGATKPYVKNLALPVIGYPAKADKVDSLETAEAVGVKSENKTSSATWKIVSVEGGKCATIKVVADDGSAYTWTFRTGEANVDGRLFSGLGQEITIDALPKHLLASVTLTQKVDVGNKNFRRFACYQPPRGYKDFDFTGGVAADTRSWGFFSDGQPFSWIEGSDAVFSEFVDAPAPTSLGYTVKKGDDFAVGKITFRFGRVNVPQSTPLFWQMVSDAKYNTTNDWIAMYQFQRKMLRAKAGFPEIAAQPCAAYHDTCTKNESRSIMDFAAEKGFKLMFLPYCPAPMEAFEGPHSPFTDCKARNMAGYPWFPCCHSPDKTRTVVEHPEWYLKDENGKLAQYFGHFYIGDMNNDEFMKWHLSVVDNMMAQGVKTVWYDMGGTGSGGVNFGTPESRISFWKQMELFRHYYQKGGWVVTEGMNPCVIDGYIFREDIYNEPVGNEFAMIGAQIHWGGFRCPFFRLAMYDIFWPMELDPVVFNFENKIGSIRNFSEAVSFVPAINDILAGGMPFIRETPFGTTWISEKSGAIFFWEGVKDFKASLPEGFEAVSLVCDGTTVDLGGKMPSSVEPKTLIVLKKK